MTALFNAGKSENKSDKKRVFIFKYLNFNTASGDITCNDCGFDLIDEINIFGAMAQVGDEFKCPNCSQLKLVIKESEGGSVKNTISSIIKIIKNLFKLFIYLMGGDIKRGK